MTLPILSLRRCLEQYAIKRDVTNRRVPRRFDLHAVPGAMFCRFFQFQGSNS